MIYPWKNFQIAAAGLLLASLLAGCAGITTNDRDAVLDDITVSEVSPDTAHFSLNHAFFTPGSGAGDWPHRRIETIRRLFFIAAAQEAKKRASPAFRIEQFDSSARSRALTNGIRMFEIRTNVRLGARVVFLEQPSKTPDETEYMTEEVLSWQSARPAG